MIKIYSANVQLPFNSTYPYKNRSKTVGPKLVSEIKASLSNKIKSIRTYKEK